MEDAVGRIRALGFDEDAALVLADHFLDADARGKSGHGTARIDWPVPASELTLSDKDRAAPLLAEAESPFVYGGSA